MTNYLDLLPVWMVEIQNIREIVLSNIVLIGQDPAGTFHDQRRAQRLIERLAGFGAVECAVDEFGSAIGVIRGTLPDKAPIFVVAYLDTIYENDAAVCHFEVTDKVIRGIGISDNSAAVGVLASLPEIFRRLSLSFQSDIILVAPCRPLGEGRLESVRRLLESRTGSAGGAICLESVELGRLDYYSDGVIRAGVECCSMAPEDPWERHRKPNAIVAINEVVNSILALQLPRQPRSRIVINEIAGGLNPEQTAYVAELGVEIRSDSDAVIKALYADIRDIVQKIDTQFHGDLRISRVSNLNAARLRIDHPLVKCATHILAELGIEAFTEPAENVLPIFLHRKTPAIALGLTRGENFHQEDAMIEIEPLYQGIAQIPAIIMAIDQGVCDA